MKKTLLVAVILALTLTSACGIFGGGAANSNVNSNKISVDDPNAVPKFESASEALKSGDEYLDKSLYKMAIGAFKQAVALAPDNGEAHFKLGVAYSLEEDLEDLPPGVEGNSDRSFRNAVKVYDKFLKAHPDDAQAWFNLGRAEGKLFEDKKAAAALKKAVDLDGENGLYRTEYGAALNKLARYGEAIRQLNKALEIDKDNLRAEDLLEKAQSGKQRVDYRPTPEKTPESNTNADENTGGPGTSGPPSNTVRPTPTPAPTRPKLPPPPPQLPPPGN